MKQLPHGIELIANSPLYKEGFNFHDYQLQLNISDVQGQVHYMHFQGCVYTFFSDYIDRWGYISLDGVGRGWQLFQMMVDDYGDLVPMPMSPALDEDDQIDVACYLYFGEAFDYSCIDLGYLHWFQDRALSADISRRFHENQTHFSDRIVDAQSGIWVLTYDFDHMHWVTELQKQPPFKTYTETKVIRSESELCDGSWTGLCPHY